MTPERSTPKTPAAEQVEGDAAEQAIGPIALRTTCYILDSRPHLYR